MTENEFDAATFSNSISPHLKENEFDASSFSNLNQHMNNNHHSPKPTFEPPNMKSLETNDDQDEYGDAQGSEGLSDNEVLLDERIVRDLTLSSKPNHFCIYPATHGTKIEMIKLIKFLTFA